jgi:CDP-diacylglycerol--glycerol-3-phosphate 3-phosphatidyltransferase
VAVAVPGQPGLTRRPIATWDDYSVAWAGLHGGVDPRRASRFVRGWLRLGYAVARPVAVAGGSPATVTAAGLLLCALVPVTALAGAGWPLAGCVLVVASAVADTADGAVAVLTGRVSRLGYLYDSVADRVGEGCWLVALWLLGVPPGLVLAAGALVYGHEYVRARAIAAGMTEVGAVTVAERPTRVIVVAVAMAFAGLAALVAPGGGAGLDGPGLVAAGAALATGVWLVLGVVGLAQLLRAAHAVLAHRGWD